MFYLRCLKGINPASSIWVITYLFKISDIVAIVSNSHGFGIVEDGDHVSHLRKCYELKRTWEVSLITEYLVERLVNWHGGWGPWKAGETWEGLLDPNCGKARWWQNSCWFRAKLQSAPRFTSLLSESVIMASMFSRVTKTVCEEKIHFTSDQIMWIVIFYLQLLKSLRKFLKFFCFILLPECVCLRRRKKKMNIQY